VSKLFSKVRMCHGNVSHRHTEIRELREECTVASLHQVEFWVEQVGKSVDSMNASVNLAKESAEFGTSFLRVFAMEYNTSSKTLDRLLEE